VIGGAATLLSPQAVFSAVAVVAAVLAAVAWSTPAVAVRRGETLASVVAALRRPAVLGGMWLFCLPALFAGVIEVLVPLHLDELGASGVAIGAIFLVAAAGEAIVSPFAGRASDRLGRLAPIRLGLAGAIVMGILLPIPDTIAIAAVALVVAILSLGWFWAPATALLSDAAEDAGLNQGVGFAVSNAGWATGHLVGGAGGAALADVTSDALPYGILSAICAATLWWVLTRTPRGAPAVPG
jgi:MFS family permease